MSDLKRVGLVGGTSWVSSEHYYRRLNEGVAAALGGSHSAPLTLWSVEFGEMARLQHDGDWTGVARILCDAARRLVDAGCDGVALAANATHLVADDVRAAIGDVTFVDLIALTTQALGDAHAVGLLGTGFTMASPMFRDAFAAAGIRTLVPTADDQQRIHATIYDELTRGVVTDETRRYYVEVVEKLAAGGAEKVVLACTEQGLVLRDGDANVPLVDTTIIHCNALVEFILEGTPS